ncbi:MAG: glycosyltransferase family 2 protein [Patescibacteria group bacterium]|nr:glycosyltransferase family 2 protein [Patescibacteria group bacterium]
MTIFCVIPAYNEAKTIKAVASEIKPLVDKVVVVDDGSTDQTYELAKSAGVDVLRHIINRGQGAALRTGTGYSLSQGAEIIVHFDADGQFLSEDIAKIVEPIESGRAEVVFGSRFLPVLNDAKESNRPGRGMPFVKKYFIMPLARAVNGIFFKIDLTDPQSGFRAMTASAARKISWQQDRMAHCSEIMLMVKKNNLPVAEVPIKVIYRNFGQNFLGGFRILKDLFIAMLVN